MDVLAQVRLKSGEDRRILVHAVKLLDWRDRWQALEQTDSLIALAVMAHLQTLETVQDPAKRKVFKMQLVRLAHERGFSSEQIRLLFRFLELVIVLPAALEQEFDHDVLDYEKEIEMPVMIPFERNAIRRGKREGRIEGRVEMGREAVPEILETRFAAVPDDITRKLESIADPRVFRRLFREAAGAATLAEFERALPQKWRSFGVGASVRL